MDKRSSDKLTQDELRLRAIRADHKRMANNIRVLRECGMRAAADATARDYTKRTGRTIA